MQKNYCSFLSGANKSVSQRIHHAVGILSFLIAFQAFADPVSTPASAPTPDLSQIPIGQLQEVQKNPNTSYQIGDRINLFTDIKTPNLENGEHLSLKLPEGSSKLEDQGWYLDPSTQFLNGTFRFIASPLQTGALTLPTLFIVKDDQTVVARTLPFTVKVAELEKKDQIPPPELLELTASSMPTKYWVIFTLITLFMMGLVSFGIYRFLKNRRKQPPVKTKAKVEPDHVIALRKINSIFTRYPYELENLKPVAFGVSETLKEFFSHRFKIDASEATTDEMIELLRNESLSRENLKEVQILFQDLDLIKFTQSEHYRTIDQHQYTEFKNKAQLIIQKWAIHTQPEGPNV